MTDVSSFPGHLDVARAIRLTPEARVRFMEALNSMCGDEEPPPSAADEIRMTPVALQYLREMANKSLMSAEQLATAAGVSEHEVRYLIMDDELDEAGMRAVLWAAGEVRLEDVISAEDVIEAREYLCAGCRRAFTTEEWNRQHGQRDRCDRFDCRCAVLHERCA